MMIRFNAHTFLILLAYCFIAIFSTVLSKPKKDLMSRLAVCSKHVQSSFSGWTCVNAHKHHVLCIKLYVRAETRWPRYYGNHTPSFAGWWCTQSNFHTVHGEWECARQSVCVNLASTLLTNIRTELKRTARRHTGTHMSLVCKGYERKDEINRGKESHKD